MDPWAAPSPSRHGARLPQLLLPSPGTRAPPWPHRPWAASLLGLLGNQGLHSHCREPQHRLTLPRALLVITHCSWSSFESFHSVLAQKAIQGTKHTKTPWPAQVQRQHSRAEGSHRKKSLKPKTFCVHGHSLQIHGNSRGISPARPSSAVPTAGGSTQNLQKSYFRYNTGD